MTGVKVAIERLKDIAALTALVGTRIYNGAAPQNVTSPFLVVRLSSDSRDHHLRGMDALQMDGILVDAYVDEAASGSKKQANDIADVICGDGNGPQASGLCGWSGVVGGSPPTAAVSGVFYGGRTETVEFDERRRWRVMQRFTMHWRQM